MPLMQRNFAEEFMLINHKKQAVVICGSFSTLQTILKLYDNEITNIG